MKQIWTSIKQKQHFFLFLMVILLIGIGVGIFLGIQNSDSIQKILPNYISQLKETPINFIANHIMIISVICILSYLLVGIPLACVYLFYEGASFGFLITGLFTLFGVKSILLIILYFLFVKVIFFLLFMLLFIKNVKVAITIIDVVVKKKQEKEKIYYLLLSNLIFLVFIVINDIFIYFIGSYIVKCLISLLQLA